MKTKEYKYIQYTDDKDYTIANVVMDGDKIVSCKLTESCLTNWNEYYNLIELLEVLKPVSWKYNDNDEACADWYKGRTETLPIIGPHTEFVTDKKKDKELDTIIKKLKKSD